MRKNGFCDADYESMDDAQRHNLLSLIREEEKRKFYELKMMLIEVIGIAGNLNTKTGYELWQKLNDRTVKEYQRICGIEQKTPDQFKYRGGRRWHKF